MCGIGQPISVCSNVKDMYVTRPARFEQLLDDSMAKKPAAPDHEHRSQIDLWAHLSLRLDDESRGKGRANLASPKVRTGKSETSFVVGNRRTIGG